MVAQTNSFNETVAWLCAGKAAVFPTDTVYGVGVSVEHAKSPQALYELKQREANKPIAWLVGGVEDLGRYGKDVPSYAYELAKQYWPGACTLIVRASEAVPAAFIPESGAVGLRMPANEMALALIREVGSPLATSSANVSGASDTGDFAHLDELLVRAAGCVVDDGLPKSGLASTVVDCTGSYPVVLRQGSVVIEETAMVDVETFNFASLDGETTIYGQLWLPINNVAPKAIVQIAHGMTEHIRRYDEFARFLVSRGFVVCGIDYVGHGYSVSHESQLGYLPLNGKDVLVGDVHQLHERITERFPNLPYILFGHSMGSFVARLYAARYGESLTAAIFCGTAQQPLLVSKAGGVLARLLAKLHGPQHRSVLIDGMGVGAYAKAIPNARTAFDWLSTDDAVVDAYIADPLCGTLFSVGGYVSLLDMTYEIATSKHAQCMPKQLPVLFIAGSLDPVGSNGKGVKQAADQLKRAGVQVVDVRLYDNMRHEILNEKGKQQVMSDLADWMDCQLLAAQNFAAQN